MSPIVSLIGLAIFAANAQSPGDRLQWSTIGHEYRQDDLPSIAAAPDGSVWTTWLSFSGDRDDIALRRFENGKWGNLQWVPATSGDNWMPQVAVDAGNRVWVVWSQRLNGNWDLCARRFDPGNQQWSAVERLTNDPLPDIQPRLVSNGKGRFALVWQGFRRKNSNIFLKTFDGERWSAEVRITRHPANDWEPAAAIDNDGVVWVAYDSYVNGNYDVFLAKVRDGKVENAAIEVAATPAFEARATLAVDTAGRVWVAWEQGPANWGKDQGHVIRDRQPGARLGTPRSAQIRCLSRGRWMAPAKPLGSVFPGDAYHPHVYSDGRGSVWVIAKLSKTVKVTGYWEYWVTRLAGDHWSEPFPLPESKGRISTRVNAVADAASDLWITWPSDSREDSPYNYSFQRPRRQKVSAGKLAAPDAALPAVLVEPPVESLVVKPGHTNEAADIRAVRSHSVTIGGRNLRIVRGDFHRHTELSWDGRNDGSLQDFYRYMIDGAGLDFGASTDHQGGSWPYSWWYSQKMTDMFNVPGAYTAIFGYERSVFYPYGHRNLFFAKRSESRVTPFFLKAGLEKYLLPPGPEGGEPGVAARGNEVVEDDTRLLYEEARERNAVVIPHTSATQQGTDWRDHAPDLEPVVEIFQGSRNSYDQQGAPFAIDPVKYAQMSKWDGYEPKGFVSNAWAKGYQLGVIASSDHGSTHISYAMVYTSDTSRQGILDAIRKRHTYGAMDNIVLDVRMGEHFMGDEFAAARPEPIRVTARGTRPVALVVIIKDGTIVYSTEPKRPDVSFEFTDKGDIRGRHYYYVRLQQDDGLLAWSSPFFVNYK